MAARASSGDGEEADLVDMLRDDSDLEDDAQVHGMNWRR